MREVALDLGARQLEALEELEALDEHEAHEAHEGVELVYVARGACTIRRAGVATSLSAGDVALLATTGAPARAEADGVRIECADGPAALVHAVFTAGDMRTRVLVELLPAVAVVRDVARDAVAAHALAALRQEARAASPDATVLMRLGEALVAVLARHVRSDVERVEAPRAAALEDEGICRALACIHRAPAEPWTAASLAKAAGMSRSSFAARFRDVVGSTPVAYLTRWRMAVAADLLRGGSRSLAEVAIDVGYASEAAFGRAFKRVVGETPASLRARRTTSTTRAAQ